MHVSGDCACQRALDANTQSIPSSFQAISTPAAVAGRLGATATRAYERLVDWPAEAPVHKSSFSYTGMESHSLWSPPQYRATARGCATPVYLYKTELL